MASAETHLRICPLCEATCGLELTTQDRQVLQVRGDKQDVFSRGFICPKGTALGELDSDPDRLRSPLIRRGNEFVEVSWSDAFSEIDRRLSAILAEHGRDSLGIYLGNPTVHNTSLSIYSQVLLRAIRSNNLFTASTVDQIPKQLANGLMYGSFTTFAVPDLDRTDYMLMLGANPLVSNGSLWTVPDVPKRLSALRKRGGKLVVVDPRRTRTAERADRHLFIRPGRDAHFLAAIAQTLFAEGRVTPGALVDHLDGLDQVESVLAEFTPEAVAGICGIPASSIREIARELSEAERSVVYARIGTCTQEFGTLASWLVDVINILTGNLDRPGGLMFPKAAAFASNTRGKGGVGPGVRIARRHSRVRGSPEVQGEFPAACMAEEIETPGQGQVRALITVAGNPALSTPNSVRLQKAMDQLDFMVSLDVYLNETTRHADVILPGESPLETFHFDVALNQLACRNNVRCSKPVFSRSTDRPEEWEILLRLSAIVNGQGPEADTQALDDLVISTQIQAALQAEGSPIEGRDFGEIMSALSPRRGPERMVDLALRSGPYGDGFGAHPEGLSLDRLQANPHGIDLGALEPRMPEVLRTPSGKIELAPELVIQDVERLRAALEARSGANGDFLLVGRRSLRSNNSWMHNTPRLMTGKPRCTLHIHPEDADRLGVKDGGQTRVRSRAGSVVVAAEITDAIMPGVVSIPHGWGHDQPGTRLKVAGDTPGVNSNILADELQIEPLSGNAVMNGIPVEVQPV